MRKLKLACAGGWHPHSQDFPYRIAQRGGDYLSYEFVGVWDDDPARGTAWAANLGVPFFEEPESLLSIDGLDGVIVTCGTSAHADIIIPAAEHGVSIFVEKPLCLNSEDARRIRDAVKRNRVHFTMSDPVKRPEFAYVKELADSGVLGRLSTVRVRFGHDQAITGFDDCFYDKKEAGGGALLGMGFHAAHVVRWFLGCPQTATGVYGSFLPKGEENGIDENAVAVFGYSEGVIGIAESTWVCPVGGGSLAVYGTKGAAFCDDTGVRYRLKDRDWVQVNKKDYPAGGRYPLLYWLDSIAEDSENTEYGIDEAVELTEMLETVMASKGTPMRVIYR